MYLTGSKAPSIKSIAKVFLSSNDTSLFASKKCSRSPFNSPEICNSSTTSENILKKPEMSIVVVNA